MEMRKIEIPSGVPQGSVSGPFLFLVFLNDLLYSLPPTIHFSVFADDIKVYHHNPHIVQNAINIISDWSVCNELPLAESKTSLLRLGSLNSNQLYFISDSPILASSSVRDLGLLTDSSLKFELHINQKIALSLLRAKQLLKSFRSSNPAFYSALFKTYVLPILEYGSSVYSPPPVSKLSIKLEKPLRYFSKIALQRCNISFSSYENRLELLNMYSIRNRRLKAQLILLYRMVSGASYFPALNSFISFAFSSRRPMLLKCHFPQNNDFFSITVPIWNSIVRNISAFLTPSQFEQLVVSSISRF
uniref:Reverse transcriptase domain-containing protein n=1 Tax=Caenorhabditis japonica TaxID=281687 RepID=A0A8R1IJE5_CAEJA